MESRARCVEGILVENFRFYVSYDTKSTENIIIITLYTFWLTSEFTTDSLVRYCL